GAREDVAGNPGALFRALDRLQQARVEGVAVDQQLDGIALDETRRGGVPAGARQRVREVFRQAVGERKGAAVLEAEGPMAGDIRAGELARAAPQAVHTEIEVQQGSRDREQQRYAYPAERGTVITLVQQRVEDGEGRHHHV